MSDPILIQIDDEVREATPEEAEQIRATQSTGSSLVTSEP